MEKEIIKEALQYIESLIEYDEETGIWEQLYYIDKDELINVYNILKQSKISTNEN